MGRAGPSDSVMTAAGVKRAIDLDARQANAITAAAVATARRLDGAERRGAIPWSPSLTFGKKRPMTLISRRTFGAAAAVALAAPFVRRADAAAPTELRCSLDTAPSHPRNVAWRDFLSKLEKASDGQIQT